MTPQAQSDLLITVAGISLAVILAIGSLFGERLDFRELDSIDKDDEVRR